MTDTQTRRAGDKTNGAHRVPPRRPRPVPRRAAQRRPPRGAYAEGRRWLLTTIAVAIALAGVAFGLQGSTRASRAQAQVAELQADIAGLQQRLAADERRAAGDRRQLRGVAARASRTERSLGRVNWELQSVPTEAQIAGVRGALAANAACVSQLGREVGGLGVSWRIDPTKPSSDYFRLITAAPPSAACAPTLSRR